MRLPFQPVRRVSDPSGETWEIYVVRMAPIGQLQPLSQGSAASLMVRDEIVAAAPMALLSFIWSCLLVPLVRLLVRAPIAAVRGRRSHTVRIQAICFDVSSSETRTWTTTVDQADSVVEEIAAGLALGKTVQPDGAVYSGVTTA
jgi:hypothetical protein